MQSLPALASRYDAPRLAHEWWRSTLPTVPATAQWETVLQGVERVAADVSLVRIAGAPAHDLYIPSPGTAMLGLQICLRGAFDVQFGALAPRRVHAGQAYLFHYAEPADGLWRLPAGGLLQMVDIRFTPAALAHWGRADLVATLHAVLGREKRTEMAAACLPAGPSLREVSQALLRSPPLRDGGLRQAWQAARIQEALVWCLDALGEHRPVCARDAALQAAVAEAAARIADACALPWTAARLAREVGLSERALQRGFQACFGMSVHGRLHEMRLALAAARLDAGASVTRAAGDAGFSSHSHFTKAFQRRYGIAPRLWRQRGYLEG
ncbi:helix-turn-helix transcriptional regulator [Orrella sp. JC864]|uniref:helix-turn-helix transcriptional regulator n=1 Tax=Orrella sp. JC864 TaxID=3120298 RepID=UPI003007F8DA